MSERHLLYTNYVSGHSGLSNGIMSIELGVILAFLTNRFLLLDGNKSPPANIVDYGGRVDNSTMSRVTDLIELPVPWRNAGELDISKLDSAELTDQHVMGSVFYVPGAVDIGSRDARDFARGRQTWLYETEELAATPVLRVSEDPVVPQEGRNRTNLGFYSYFFYLDNETRRAVYQMLQRMQAKAPYLELAKKVTADLGTFNAIHMRRGDFKVTYGVTVLDRQPWEAIDAMDQHFDRDERLLVCTDERDDPFFDEIRNTYKDHIYIDHHILDEYGKEFAALPHHDSVALAYLSQLVAAGSQDFIGTMTSTFTAMIQRFRGNRGKEEKFKFFWNELPDPGERAERGRHPVSDCVPLDKGVMIEEFEGRYSWNRFTSLINPAWMREWPESFITATALDTGELEYRGVAESVDVPVNVNRTEAIIPFEGLCVRVKSAIPGLAFRLTEVFHSGNPAAEGNVVAEYEIKEHEGTFLLFMNGEEIDRAGSLKSVPERLARQMVPLLSGARRLHSWLSGMVFQQAGRTVLYTGDMGSADDHIADALCSAGWELIADVAIPIRAKSAEIVPFSRCAWPKGAASRVQHSVTPVTAVVHASQHLHAREHVVELSPSVGVAELICESFDFRFDRERAVERLCKIVERLQVFELTFSSAARVPDVLGFLAEFESPAVPPVEKEDEP